MFVLTYSKNVNASERHNSFRYYFPKPFFDDYNIIINGKSFSDQPIDSDIKPYDKVRKVITRQGEDYTTDVCKTFYRLVAVDLSKKKKN